MLDNVCLYAFTVLDRPVASNRSGTSRKLAGKWQAFHCCFLARSIVNDVLSMAVSGKNSYFDFRPP